MATVLTIAVNRQLRSNQNRYMYCENRDPQIGRKVPPSLPVVHGGFWKGRGWGVEAVGLWWFNAAADHMAAMNQTL